MGPREEAKSFLRKQLADHPDPHLVARLAQMERLSDPKKARAMLLDWVNAHPKDAEVRLTYAELLTSLSEDAAAREQYEQILRDRRTTRSP